MFDKEKIMLSSLAKSRYVKSISSRKVFIVFAGIIGDTVCFLPTIKKYKEIFKKSDGYEVTYFLKPVAHKFLDAIEGYSDLHIIDLDYTKFCSDYQYYKKIKHQYFQQPVEYVICPQRSISASIVALNIKATYKIGLEYTLPCNNKLKAIIFDKAFNKKVIVQDDITTLPAMNGVLNSVATRSYRNLLPHINSDHSPNSYGDYCVLGPYSSVVAKEWEIEKFAEIAKKAIQENLKVVLVGNTKDDSKIKTFFSLVHTENVINLINKTSFSEWIDVIRNAKFLVSCDSAAVHIAAGVDTPCVCISGGMDEGLMYPYVVDELETNQYLPIIIMSKHEDCFKCRRIGEYYGYGNPTCKKEIEANKPMLCIQKISVDQVWNGVAKILRDLGK